MARALAEGAERAIAGARDDPQNHSRASYAAPFTDGGALDGLGCPMRVIQRRVTALNLVESLTARATFEGRAYLVERATPRVDRRLTFLARSSIAMPTAG
jgi:hypothetical protein